MRFSLQSLLDDFSGYNIDTAAAMVENAGYFLMNLPESHQRMTNMLDVSLFVWLFRSHPCMPGSACIHNDLIHWLLPSLFQRPD